MIPNGPIQRLGADLERHTAGYRTALTGAFMGVAAGLSAAVRYHTQQRVRLEEAALRLAKVIPPNRREEVLAEVQRRRAFMGESEASASESVYDDVVKGRWPR